MPKEFLTDSESSAKLETIRPFSIRGRDLAEPEVSWSVSGDRRLSLSNKNIPKDGLNTERTANAETLPPLSPREISSTIQTEVYSPRTEFKPKKFEIIFKLYNTGKKL
jgi:hypothetical protein